VSPLQILAADLARRCVLAAVDHVEAVRAALVWEDIPKPSTMWSDCSSLELVSGTWSVRVADDRDQTLYTVRGSLLSVDWDAHGNDVYVVVEDCE